MTTAGLDLLVDRILDQNPTSVLDVRAGSGILGSRLRSLQPALSLTAMEEDPRWYRLHGVYNQVLCAKPATVMDPRGPAFDVVVLHEPDSGTLRSDGWGLARDNARTAAYMTIPLDRWDPRWVQRWFFGISECWQDETTGYYGWYRGTP